MNKVKLITYSKLEDYNSDLVLKWLKVLLNKNVINDEVIKEKCKNFFENIDFSFIVSCKNTIVKYALLEQISDYLNVTKTDLMFTMNVNELNDFFNRNHTNDNLEMKDISNQMLNSCLEVVPTFFNNPAIKNHYNKVKVLKKSND